MPEPVTWGLLAADESAAQSRWARRRRISMVCADRRDTSIVTASRSAPLASNLVLTLAAGIALGLPVVRFTNRQRLAGTRRVHQPVHARAFRGHDWHGVMHRFAGIT